MLNFCLVILGCIVAAVLVTFALVHGGSMLAMRRDGVPTMVYYDRPRRLYRFRAWLYHEWPIWWRGKRYQGFRVLGFSIDGGDFDPAE